MVRFDIEPADTTDITQSFPDECNQGLQQQASGPQNTFVDDPIMTELTNIVRQAAISSVLTANLFIGDPSLVEEPINEQKFEKFFRYVNEVLGFIINTRSMTISYPQDKRDNLLHDLTQHKWSSNQTYPVRDFKALMEMNRRTLFARKEVGSVPKVNGHNSWISFTTSRALSHLQFNTVIVGT